jgi:hypothetical protein
VSSVGCTRLTLTCKADGRGKAKPVCIDRPAKQDCTYSFIHSFIQAMMMMNITGLCCVIEVAVAVVVVVAVAVVVVVVVASSSSSSSSSSSTQK